MLQTKLILLLSPTFPLQHSLHAAALPIDSLIIMELPLLTQFQYGSATPVCSTWNVSDLLCLSSQLLALASSLVNTHKHMHIHTFLSYPHKLWIQWSKIPNQDMYVSIQTSTSFYTSPAGTLGMSNKTCQSGLMEYTCNPSTRQTETGGQLHVQCQPGLHSEI